MDKILVIVVQIQIRELKKEFEMSRIKKNGKTLPSDEEINILSTIEKIRIEGAYYIRCKTESWFWKLYKKTLNVIIDVVLGRMWPSKY